MIETMKTMKTPCLVARGITGVITITKSNMVAVSGGKFPNHLGSLCLHFGTPLLFISQNSIVGVVGVSMA
jgi:hypothetical protein